MSKSRRFNVYDFNSRLFSVMALIGLCLLGALGRAFYLQVLSGEDFRDLAKRQHERTLVLEPRRQPIYDRNGRILAVSVRVESIHAVPQKVSSPADTARDLAPILELPAQTLQAKLTGNRSFVWLKRQVRPEISAQVRSLELPGIEFIKEYRRYYPAGNFASQVLGFTGVDSQGLAGLEYEYQDLLQGDKKTYVVEPDGQQRLVQSSKADPLGQGKSYSLHLSLDSSIQYFTEKALKRGVTQMQAKHGIALVMESKTGALLAMANYPSFDPNHYGKFRPATYLNRAVTGGYEPGSTFKMVTLAIALELKLIQANQSFFCEKGAYQLDREVIHDTSPHDWLTLEGIIQKSSNICASKIGLLIPRQQFYDYIQKFGFGNRVNVGLSAEATGKILPPEKWKQIEHATISFGHGILASPLQVLTALNVLANNGIMVNPYLIEHVEDEEGRASRELQDASGQVVLRFGPHQGQRVLSEATAKTIRKFMVSVTQKGGTGTLGTVRQFNVAGKTGTSEIFNEETQSYSRTDHIATFVGIVPAEDPVLTILVVIERPQNSAYGGVAAAPVFKEIAERTLPYLHVLPPPVQMATTDSSRSKP